MSSGAILVAVAIGFPALYLALRAADSTKVPDDWIWVRRQANRIGKWREARVLAERAALLAEAHATLVDKAHRAALEEDSRRPVAQEPEAVVIVRQAVSGGVIRAFRQPIGR